MVSSEKSSGTGMASLRKNFRFDFAAGISVALVAIPLSLGIALASGTPPISGLIASILGGLVASFYSGVKVGIKGPAAGLIAVTIMAMAKFNTGNLLETFSFVLATYFVSGVLMTLIGLLRMGKLGDVIPSAVVKGLMAAIGLIIISKQINVGLGTEAIEGSSLDILINIDSLLLKLNPIVTIITLNCLAVLILFPRIKNKIIQILPPPMWALLIAVPFVFLFDFFVPRDIELLGQMYSVGPSLLISIPENIFASFIYPNFAFIDTLAFWGIVFTLTLVSTIECIASAKGLEKLDPLKRKSEMNKDLIGVGITTCLSALIGGLPVITVVVRSSVNINNGAKTQVSNFVHGAFVLGIIFLFGSYFEYIPEAALAAILLFTGYRLCSPKVFKNAYFKGIEQVIILLVTLIATLATTLIYGIVIGILVTLLVHIAKSGMSARLFFKYLARPNIKTVKETQGYFIKVKGVANFFNILKLKNILDSLPEKKHLVLEFSNARLIDHTVLEYIHDHCNTYNRSGGKMELVGLDIHEASTEHPYSIHVHRPPTLRKLSKRQQQMQGFAHRNNWEFNPDVSWEIGEYYDFHFFDTRPLEYKKNVIRGFFNDKTVEWEIADITFDEGAFIAKEVYHTTIQVVHLPFEIPVFSMEKEQFTDRVLELAGFSDIDFTDHKKFSKNFLLNGPNKEAIYNFFTRELREFFVEREMYHLESNGKSLMIFKFFRLASFENLVRMVNFSNKLVQLMEHAAENWQEEED